MVRVVYVVPDPYGMHQENYEAILVEYDQEEWCFTVWAWGDGRKVLLTTMYGNIEDQHDTEDVFFAVGQYVYKYKIPMWVMDPAGTYVWQDGQPIPGPNYIKPLQVNVDDIPF